MTRLRRIIAAAVAAAACIATTAGVVACADTDADTDYYIYMPDGAPALAMAQLMAEDMGFGYDVYYEAVDSSTISTYVTGTDPEADICILPVNLAAQLLGRGETYRMLGTVTHGNLYILTKTGEDYLTADNIDSLTGKTVGVINISAVPGLTFEVVLNQYDLKWQVVDTGVEDDDDKVNLHALSSASDVGATEYDYYVLAEPAAATLSSNQNLGLSYAGSLQELYGSQDGYPQAVMVAKKSLIEENPEFVKNVISAVEANAEWIKNETTDIEAVVSAIAGHLTDGMAPTFSASNLSAKVIENCAVYFTEAAKCKEEVVTFLDNLSEVSLVEYTVYDVFFYGYDGD